MHVFKALSKQPERKQVEWLRLWLEDRRAAGLRALFKALLQRFHQINHPAAAREPGAAPSCRTRLAPGAREPITQAFWRGARRQSNFPKEPTDNEGEND